MRRCSVGPGICIRGVSPSIILPHFAPPFPIFPSLTSRAPLKQLRGLGSAVRSPSEVRGGAPAENKFGALYKAVRKPLAAIVNSEF